MLRTKQYKSRGSIKSIISLGIGMLLAVAALAMWLNRQYVLDWIAYHEFQPSSEVAQIVDQTAMSETGKFYFYASKPAIETSRTFNASCERKESGSAILGCYADNQIHIYDVTNDTLAGIKEVTAAHEMLHAAYRRLSSDDKSKVNALLETQYKSLQNNQDLAKRMEFYKQNEAGEEDNELHSIIATEVASISPELENYYKKYFTDRAKVVALHTSYASVFDQLKQKADDLLVRLKALGPQIEADSKSYNAAVQQLNNDIQAFNTRATADDFSSRAAFTAERNDLVTRSGAIDKERSRINGNLQAYEQLRQEYNATAATSNDLYKSLDSKLAPSPSV